MVDTKTDSKNDNNDNNTRKLNRESLIIGVSVGSVLLAVIITIIVLVLTKKKKGWVSYFMKNSVGWVGKSVTKKIIRDPKVIAAIVGLVFWVVFVTIGTVLSMIAMKRTSTIVNISVWPV